MDGAARLFTEGGVSMSVFKGKFVEAKVLELVLGEAQLPGDVGPADGEGVIVFDDEGHGEVVK